LALRRTRLATGIVGNIEIGNGGLVMRIYQNNWKYFFFCFLEHRNNEDPSIIRAYDKTWVVNRRVSHMISDYFIREEELELVLVVVVSEYNWVEVDETVRDLFGIEMNRTQK
jgi:hypothetical protein